MKCYLIRESDLLRLRDRLRKTMSVFNESLLDDAAITASNAQSRLVNDSLEDWVREITKD